MLAGIFHKGSGLGDQLHRYITVRTLAEDKGLQWGMLVDGKGFKGSSFMKGDFYGQNPVALGWPHAFKHWTEKDVRDSQGNDIRSFDPESQFIEDFTIVDGYFEDEKYWGHNLDNIREWLKVEHLDMPDNVCVIGFRGGEFYSDSNLGLPKSYYDKAMEIMNKKYPRIKYEVHTDDPIKAQQFFPDFKIIQDIGINWRSVRYAKHLIISNSAFYIMPSLLGEAKEVIAPRYWARRNTQTWARPACYYHDRRWKYI